MMRILGTEAVIDPSKAEKEVTDSVDRLVWYAGWSDKISTISRGYSKL